MRLSEVTTSRGPGLYLVLVGIQTVGIVVLLLNGLPIYRDMTRDLSRHQPQPGLQWWAWAAMALVFGGYVLRMRLRPGMPASGHAFLGHLISFVGRLSFVVATSTFSLIYINRFGELNIPAYRLALLPGLLLALYCWNLELGRLAKALIGNAGEPLTSDPPRSDGRNDPSPKKEDHR